MALWELDHNDAIIAIKSLKSHKKFVRGTKGQDLKLSIIVENIENDNRIKANALLDSGATGSCINREFVERHQLPIQKLPIKMPVYNADGTLNADGSIEGYTQLQMFVEDHSEQIELAVTNLGNTDIFLGLD